MTWPFENNTSAIVKKIADRSMKADKRRNVFIIITIAFAVSLMMVLALYNLGTLQEKQTQGLLLVVIRSKRTGYIISRVFAFVNILSNINLRQKVQKAL